MLRAIRSAATHDDPDNYDEDADGNDLDGRDNDLNFRKHVDREEVDGKIDNDEDGDPQRCVFMLVVPVTD